MIIVGEKLNSSIKQVEKALEIEDAAFIGDTALKQAEAGAHYLDINAGSFPEKEPDKLEWLINTVQERVSVPLVIDSPNPVALKRALKANKNGKPIVNSITGERERYGQFLPLVLEYGAGVIALCMDDGGMPETADGVVSVAEKLIKRLEKDGVALEDIYVDPAARPVGVNPQCGLLVLDAIRGIRARFPEIHIICGLSNISYGLPARRLLNRTFLTAALAAGLDCAILDPLDQKLMAALYAARALLGKDEYCVEYISKFREGFLDV